MIKLLLIVPLWLAMLWLYTRTRPQRRHRYPPRLSPSQRRRIRRVYSSR